MMVNFFFFSLLTTSPLLLSHYATATKKTSQPSVGSSKGHQQSDDNPLLLPEEENRDEDDEGLAGFFGGDDDDFVLAEDSSSKTLPTIEKLIVTATAVGDPTNVRKLPSAMLDQLAVDMDTQLAKVIKLDEPDRDAVFAYAERLAQQGEAENVRRKKGKSEIGAEVSEENEKAKRRLTVLLAPGVSKPNGNERWAELHRLTSATVGTRRGGKESSSSPPGASSSSAQLTPVVKKLIAKWAATIAQRLQTLCVMDHQEPPLDHPDVPLLQLVDHFSLIRSVRQRRPLLQALDVLHEDVGLLTRFFEQVMAVTSAAKVSPHMMARQAVVLLRISRLPLLRSDSWQQTKITKEKKMSGKKKGQDKAETVEQCVLREEFAVAIRENWRLELAMSIFQVLNVTFAQHTTSSSKRRPPQSSPVVVVRVYDDGGESAVLQPVISRLADPDEWFDEEEAGGGDMLLPFFKMLLEEQRANAEDANANNASEALIPVDFLVEKLATLHALRRRLRFFFPHQNQQTPVRTHTQTMALGAGVCATLALAPDAALRDHVVDVLSSPRTRPTIAWLNMFYMAWRVDEQNRPPRLRAIDDATIGGMTDVDTPPRQQQQQTKQKKMQTLTQVRAPPKEQAQSPNEKLIHAPTEEKTDVIVSKEMKGKAQVGAPKEKKEQEDAPKDKKAQEAAPKAKKAREYASKEKKGKAQVARPSREENEDTKKQTETTGKGRRTHRPKGVSAVAVVADATTTTTTVAKTSTSSSSPSSSSSQATLSTSTTAKRFIETLCEWSDLFLEAANIFPSSPPSFSEGNHASDAQAAVARLNLAHAFWLMGDEAHRNRVRTAIHAARLTLADTGEIFLHPLFGLLVNPRELFLEPGSLLRRGEAPVNLLVVDGIVAELTTAFQLADVLRFQRRVEEEGGGQPPLSFNCLLYVFASIVRTSADARLEEARIMAKAGIVDQYDFLKVLFARDPVFYPLFERLNDNASIKKWASRQPSGHLILSSLADTDRFYAGYLGVPDARPLLDRLHRAASVWHELLALPWWEEEVPVTLEDLVELVGVLIDLVPTVGEPILQLLKRMMKSSPTVLLHAKQVEWMLTKQTLMDWHAFDATPAAAGSSGGGGKPAAELAILERCLHVCSRLNALHMLDGQDIGTVFDIQQAMVTCPRNTFVKHMRPFLHPFFTDKGRAEECLKQLEAVATGEGLPVSELERRFVRWAGRMTMDRERRHRHLHKLQQPAVVDRLAQASTKSSSPKEGGIPLLPSAEVGAANKGQQEDDDDEREGKEEGERSKSGTKKTKKSGSKKKGGGKGKKKTK